MSSEIDDAGIGTVRFSASEICLVCSEFREVPSYCRGIDQHVAMKSSIAYWKTHHTDRQCYCNECCTKPAVDIYDVSDMD